MEDEVLMPTEVPEDNMAAGMKNDVPADGGGDVTGEQEQTPESKPGEAADEAHGPADKETDEGADGEGEPEEETDVTPNVSACEQTATEPFTEDGDPMPTVQKNGGTDGNALDKLRLLSAGCGQTLEELAESLLAASDRALYERLLEEAGGNEALAERLMEGERLKRDDALRKADEESRKKEDDRARERTLCDRLAGEFTVLQKEFPGGFSTFSQVPDTVIRAAAGEGITLLDAYLRFIRAEEKRVAEAKRQRELARAAATGSKADSPADEGAGRMAEAVSEGFARAFR